MRQVDTILAKFPGPVTLTISRRKALISLTLCIVVAGFCVLLLVAGRVYDWHDTMMAWLGIVLFGAFAVRSLVLLMVPGGASLKLDADGFEINSPFSLVRTSWRDVSGFRVRESDDDAKVPQITYEARGGAAKETRVLPDNYGLSNDDLARLMEAWRRRALKQVAR